MRCENCGKHDLIYDRPSPRGDVLDTMHMLSECANYWRGRAKQAESKLGGAFRMSKLRLLAVDLGVQGAMLCVEQEGKATRALKVAVWKKWVREDFLESLAEMVKATRPQAIAVERSFLPRGKLFRAGLSQTRKGETLATAAHDLGLLLLEMSPQGAKQAAQAASILGFGGQAAGEHLADACAIALAGLVRMEAAKGEGK